MTEKMQVLTEIQEASKVRKYKKRTELRPRSYSKLLEPKVIECKQRTKTYLKLLELKTKSFWLMYRKLPELRTRILKQHLGSCKEFMSRSLKKSEESVSYLGKTVGNVVCLS